jgi:uncharacterized membrane protein
MSLFDHCLTGLVWVVPVVVVLFAISAFFDGKGR